MCILTIILSTISLAASLFSSFEYLPESGRKTPQHIGGLPPVCMLLYRILVQLLEYICCLAARNMNIFKNSRGLFSWKFSCRIEKNDHIPAFIAKMYNMWGFASMFHICLRYFVPKHKGNITYKRRHINQQTHSIQTKLTLKTSFLILGRPEYKVVIIL